MRIYGVQKSQSPCAVCHTKVNIETIHLDLSAAMPVDAASPSILNKLKAGKIIHGFSNGEVHLKIFLGILV